MEAENKMISLLKPSQGGGGGGTDDYSDLSNKPKINSVTLSGNKTSAQLGLVGDVQVNGTSVTASGVANIPVATSSTAGVVKVSGTQGMQITSSGLISGLTRTEVQWTDMDNSAFACKGTLANIQNSYVRAVSPACTTLSGTTATITANTTYAHAIGSSGCVYTISTPTDTSTVYNGFVLLIDTTNSASIAFSTDGSPATTISISGNPTIQTGKKYTVTGQYSPLANEWQLFIISYDT